MTIEQRVLSVTENGFKVSKPLVLKCDFEINGEYHLNESGQLENGLPRMALIQDHETILLRNKGEDVSQSIILKGEEINRANLTWTPHPADKNLIGEIVYTPDTPAQSLTL